MDRALPRMVHSYMVSWNHVCVHGDWQSITVILLFLSFSLSLYIYIYIYRSLVQFAVRKNHNVMSCIIDALIHPLHITLEQHGFAKVYSRVSL